MAEPKDTGKKKTKKKRAEPVYVPVNYPVWLGAASFAWAVAGWLIAAFAPRLAFVPLAGAVHLLLPAVTVGLLGANLYFAVRSLLRGAHVLRLALVTGVEVALFTTLFFQLYAHVGAELYDAPGPTSPWQWFAFSAAHAFRAGDVFDAVEALGWGIQPVKHTSPLVGVFVIAYHVVVDVFFLGLVWAVVGRIREVLLADDEFRGMLVRFGLGAFAIWFVTWVVVAFFVRPWRMADVVLWWVENVLRVVDFADVMESFGLRLHTLPREGIVGWLTLLCRLWIALGLAVALTRKRKPPPRRVLTPPGVVARSYWRLRVGALAGMAVVLFATGLAGWLAAESSADALVAAVKEGPDDRADAALRALRRMGPSANATVEPLVAARTDATPGVRDGITRTLGYLGKSAVPHLRDIALKEPADAAGRAVDGLAEVGGPAAPDLVAVWSGTTDDAVKARADAAIRSLGGSAVSPLIEGFTPDNAYGHYVWLQRLDANWRMRGTANPTARACHELEDLKSRAGSGDAARATAALTQARACGTAARELLDVAYDNLNQQDVGLQGAAAGVVTAAGPAETPKVLQLARATPAKREIAPGVRTVLNDPAMWSPAVLADRNTLPALLALADRPETFPVAVRHLGHYGPAAAPAAGALIPKVADPDAGTRAAVRTTLDRVHPKWKDDPALNDAVPSFLLRLPKLPPAEADELFAAIKPLTTGQAQAVVAAVEGELKELENKYGETQGADWEATGRERYAKALDGVFAPVERLGLRAKTAVLELRLLHRRNESGLSAWRAPVANERLTLAMERLGGDTDNTLRARLATLGYGPEGLAFLVSKGQVGVSFVGGLLGSSDDQTRLNGVKAAAAFGRAARPLTQRLLDLLPDSNRRVRAGGSDEVWLLGELARALTAVDPTWWEQPDATAALGRLLQLTAPDADSAAARQRVLDLVAGADAAAAPKIAAGAVRAGVVDPPVKAVFDKLAPDWRTDPDVKAAAPEMINRLAERDLGARAERALLDLGPTGAAATVATVAGLSDAAVAGRAQGGKEAEVRDRAIEVLGKFDPPPKEAVPVLLKLAAKPKLDVGALPGIVATLDKVSPGWASDIANRLPVEAAARELERRAYTDPRFIGHAGRFGGKVGGLLVQKFEAAKSDPEALAALEQIVAAGPSGRDALKVLTKIAFDTNGRNRLAVIEAIGKIAAGNEGEAVVYSHLLFDPSAKVRAATAAAMTRMDPKWRANQKVWLESTARDNLKDSTDPDRRAAAVEVLGQTGAGDASLVTLLCPVVLDTEPVVRTAAGKALDGIDPNWRTKPAAKDAAAKAVAQLKAPEARKRFDAVGALEVLRPPTAVASLEQLVARETDANTRRYAEEVLGRLRKSP